jgi:hypothetical protein
MTTRADAIEVMTIVAACHRRTAPRMDDEQATLATASVWAELFSIYRLELADLIAAVKKRALSVADAPEPAEIIAFARDIRRDRAERETDAQRQAREDQRDAELDRRTLRAVTDHTGHTVGKLVGDA